MNPYRAAFYQRQAEWHRYEGPDQVRERHELRSRYYEWYTRDWLPEDRDGKILDIGCGSGQFLYFLRKKGYTQAKGVDVDQDADRDRQGPRPRRGGDPHPRLPRPLRIQL